MRLHAVPRLATIVAALCLAGGGLGAGLTAALSGGTPPAVTSRPAYRPTPPAITRLSASINTPQVAATVDPAVVNVNTTLDALEGGGQAAGTGMIVSPNGEIVTNNHVVQGADTGPRRDHRSRHPRRDARRYRPDG